MEHKLQKILRLMAFVNYRHTYLRQLIKAQLGRTLLLGLLLLNSTAAQAALIKVESFWNNINTNFSLNTTTFIESSSFTGIGTETISLVSFNLQFIDIRPGVPDSFFTAELSPSNEIFIRFLDGVVLDYSSSTTIGLDPGNNHLVFNPSLDRLIRVFPLVGQSNYVLQPGSVVTLPTAAIPLPAAGILFLTGLIGLFGVRLGKRSL